MMIRTLKLVFLLIFFWSCDEKTKPQNPPNIIVIITAATFPVPKKAITGIIKTKAGIVCIKSIIGLIIE